MISRRWPEFTLLLAAATVVFLPEAQAASYELQPRRIAPDTYVIEGAREDFSLTNGGNILNTGFIVTDAGVIVVDTGPSRLYGEAMRAAISRVSEQPLLRAYNTHAHPDHFLGNQAFQDTPIAALPATRYAMSELAETFLGNMYRLAGDFMRGTDVVLPTEEVEPGRHLIGGHQLELIALRGHTDADLAIYDRTTGVLFAGDLVFNKRAPTTPNADLKAWLASLATLQALEFRWLVPGHGPVAGDPSPLAATREYLSWLDSALATAAESGLDMAEALHLTIPAQYGAMAVMPTEFQRSVTHLYGRLQRRALGPAVSAADSP